ncbi:MAG: hypothetical protein IJ703_02855 [Eubacterium sp.]|nr:hypothetical protein [Eubacterium sp.]
MIEINDLELPELAVYKQRSEVQLLRINESAPGIFICESANVIRRALDAGYEAISILTAIKEPDEEKLAIILGNEGYGLKTDTIENSTYVAKIPMKPGVDSLNVGAASAVMFWELAGDRLSRGD